MLDKSWVKGTETLVKGGRGLCRISLGWKARQPLLNRGDKADKYWMEGKTALVKSGELVGWRA
jgi:hypothetical protein